MAEADRERRQAGAGARTNMNVFLNMTNAFNRVHYGTPSGVLTATGRPSTS